MDVRVFESREEMGHQAAKTAAEDLKRLLSEKETVTVVAATGASQFEFLAALTAEAGIDWNRVTFFHLDEYVGLGPEHPASFRRYLRERIVEKVRPRQFHFVRGDADDPLEECRRLGDLIRRYSVDLSFIGIGENGHIAFNDPPADFGTEEPFIVVELDEACRRQQLGEGWFPTLEEVPTKAISMSVRQILNSDRILCIVPDRRKAEAVKKCLTEPIRPEVPCTILREHPDTVLFLDRDAASLLEEQA